MNEEEQLLMIASLCKRGSGDEIREFFATQELEQTEESFVSYMDYLIKKSGMSRARIIENVGLSKDYMYKVLRGDKRTTERDYLIAVCLSMGANVLETQKALELYPFQTLSAANLREGIILAAINEGVSCYDLDCWLEKCSQPLLKVSPDMPSAKIGPARSTVYSGEDIYSSLSRESDLNETRRYIEMKVTNTFSVSEQYGNAPMDLFVMGELELTAEDDTKVYAVAVFYPGEDPLYGIATKSIQEDDDKQNEMLEEYHDLESASESKYFRYYLELEKITDQEYANGMAKVNDTRNYNFRMGFKNGEHGLEMYCEGFNSTQPEYSEYLQIRRTKAGYIFSAAHRSCYMKLELGKLMYEAYFGIWEEPEYLFEITSLEDIGKYDYFKSGFTQMMEYLDNMAKKSGFGGYFDV